MPRPKVYEEARVATAVRLPRSLRGELERAASERDVSVNLLVTRAVADYLRRLRPVEEYLESARQVGSPEHARVEHPSEHGREYPHEHRRGHPLEHEPGQGQFRDQSEDQGL